LFRGRCRYDRQRPRFFFEPLDFAGVATIINIECLFYPWEKTVVKREFIVERQGKSFVLYAGLLDLAHSQGLRAIRTRLVQVPAEENNQTAIVHAEVETDRGTFSGLGDANPANVSRAMLTHTIRLAETRAKARALRDAVNVGVAAVEELGDLDETVEVRPLAAAHVSLSNGVPEDLVSVPTPPGRPAVPQPSATALATPAQVRAIYSIARDQHSMSEGEVDERSQSLFGAAPVELTRKQASDLISSLKGARYPKTEVPTPHRLESTHSRHDGDLELA